MMDDVNEWVSPEEYDGVAVYNAFEANAYWGTSIDTDAGTGWFSVAKSEDVGPDSWAIVCYYLPLSAMFGPP